MQSWCAGRKREPEKKKYTYSLAKAPETSQLFTEFEHKEKYSEMEAFHHICFICHFIYLRLII